MPSFRMSRPDLQHARIVTVDETDSTNRLARDMARAGAEEWTVVRARRQTAGRGRLGRSWCSSGDFGLWFSVVLHPPFRADRAGMIGVGAACAVAQAICDLGGTHAAVKWPNDVLIDGRKVSGILAESSTVDSGLVWVVLGIGINMEPPEGGFPPELAGIATAVSEHAAGAVDREEMLHAFLREFATRYAALCAGDVEAVRCEAAMRMAAMLGKRVTVKTACGDFDAEALGLGENGGLIVRRYDGEVSTVSSADVSLGTGYPR